MNVKKSVGNVWKCVECAGELMNMLVPNSEVHERPLTKTARSAWVMSVHMEQCRSRDD
jgi:hypothetical protein